MPMTARVCPEPGCPTLVEPGQPGCPAHARPPWQGAGGKRGSVNWAYRTRIRPAILRPDGYRCVDCGNPATQVDHLDRLADGGPLIARPDRMQAVCFPCHTKREQARKREARG